MISRLGYNNFSFYANIFCFFLVVLMCSSSFAEPEKKQQEKIDATNTVTQTSETNPPANYTPIALPASTDCTVIADPLEKINRGMFCFNEHLDTAIMRPVANLYNKIIPKPLNKGIYNFFNNINNLTTIWNDILQLHFYQMTSDLWRLAINTTIGIGGLFDVASCMGLQQYGNDFGMTLARYGWKNSMYIVWPFWGPSTLRDGLGAPVDYFYFSIYPGIPSTTTRYGVYGLGVISHRARLLQFQSVMEEAALDKYLFVRSAYLQRRKYQIEQNELPFSLPEGNCVDSN